MPSNQRILGIGSLIFIHIFPLLESFLGPFVLLELSLLDLVEGAI